MELLLTAAPNLTAPPASWPCKRWPSSPEGAVFHLANVFFFLGLTGGSGLYGRLYLFTLLTAGFSCSALWAWRRPCGTAFLLWSLALAVVCLAQVGHLGYRLRSLVFLKEFQELYNAVFKKLGVPLTLFGKVVACSEGAVHRLEPQRCFALEGKTAIDKLSVLLSGRVRVTVDGEFLHFIHPFQFLDSPEWDSLRPSEEGVFQVTLCADQPCTYVTWRRKKLYLLFAQHRYVARIFALLVRNDIAEKLYSLEHTDRWGRRYDLRLPAPRHQPETDLEKTHVLLQVPP